jgi:hypothetical protein
MTFHTALSTGLPAAGARQRRLSPGPTMLVPADKLRTLLGDVHRSAVGGQGQQAARRSSDKTAGRLIEDLTCKISINGNFRFARGRQVSS